jgi:hypothetical protein
MKFDIENRLDDLYSDYLMEFHSDTIRTKDQLIKAIENNLYREAFEIEVLKGLGLTKEEIKAIRGFDEVGL